MPTQEQLMRVINYKTMRVIVGLIALLMPPAVVLLSGQEDLTSMSSISISYWTDSRDIFVGSLFAVGFFLAAYNGTGKYERSEKWISRVACFFAVIVADNQKAVPTRYARMCVGTCFCASVK